MSESVDINDLKALFRDGRNLMKELRERHGSQQNSVATILYSYDIQAGTYVKSLEDPAMLYSKQRHAAALASVLEPLRPDTLLDAGTGEATTLALVLDALKRPAKSVLAFDVSLSRLLYAKRFLERHSHRDVVLFTSALENIPLTDQAVDVVVTSHALEPNAGREREMLKELLRVAGKYIVLIEPSWELGSQATRDRISEHGYIRGLPDILVALGAKIIRHEAWAENVNPANEAALIVAKPPAALQDAERIPALRSPIGLGPLIDRNSYLYSEDDGFAFPVIEGIACLLAENGVLASRLSAFLP